MNINKELLLSIKLAEKDIISSLDKIATSKTKDNSICYFTGDKTFVKYFGSNFRNKAKKFPEDEICLRSSPSRNSTQSYYITLDGIQRLYNNLKDEQKRAIPRPVCEYFLIDNVVSPDSTPSDDYIVEKKSASIDNIILFVSNVFADYDPTRNDNILTICDTRVIFDDTRKSIIPTKKDKMQGSAVIINDFSEIPNICLADAIRNIIAALHSH